MKIIDILVAKANGTLEDGFEFKYQGMHYAYFKKVNDIQRIKDGRSIGRLIALDEILNDKIEAIEENKEIEELNDTNYLDNMIAGEKEYYHNITRTRLNEVIRAVNKLIKEREEK